MKKAALYAAACLLLPVSWGNAFILIYGQFYSVYIIVISLLLSMLFRTKSGTMKWIKLAVMLLLSVWSGMHGVRMLMLCSVPLMLTLVWMFIDRVRVCKTIREAWGVLHGLYVMETVLILAGMLTGYLVNHLVFSRQYAFSSFSDTQFVDMNWNAFFGQFNMSPEYFGFVDGVQLISLNGFVNAVVLLISVGVLINLCNMFLRRKCFSKEMCYTVVFACVSIVVGIVCNCMTDFGLGHGRNSVAYYLPGLMLMVAMAFARLEKEYRASDTIQKAALLMACVMFGVCSLQYIRSGMKSNDADYEVGTRDLLDLGYTTGFATFWNANLLTEISGGEIDV